jgi:hypothetical protein
VSGCNRPGDRQVERPQTPQTANRKTQNCCRTQNLHRAELFPRRRIHHVNLSREVRTNQGKCREDAGERFERPLRRRLRNCVLAQQAFVILPPCESASVGSCKTCRFRERWRRTAANVAAAMARRLLCWTAAVLLADAVLFDLVLKRTEADAKQFGRFLAMVSDFGKGPPDRFTFNRFQCGP